MTAPSPRQILFSLQLLLAAAAAACQPPITPVEPYDPQEPPPKLDSYQRSGVVHARRFRLTSKLAVPSIESFARLSPKASGSLAALKRASTTTIDAFATVDRLLVVLPPEHPAGPIELVLSDDLDRLFVFQSENKRALALPRGRLADILDGAAPSAREAFSNEIEGPRREEGPLPRLLWSAKARIAFRYRPPANRASSWSIRAMIEASGPPYGGLFPAPHPLLHLALPLLQNRRGVLVLEALQVRFPEPVRWVTTILNESRGGAFDVRSQTEVQDLGELPLPAKRFAVVREKHRWVRTITASQDGRQLIKPDKLGDLRSGQNKGALTIANRSSFAANIYVDGVLLGWVTSGDEHVFEGLKAGYYRVFAATPTGVRAWGPRDIYLPGSFTLRD